MGESIVFPWKVSKNHVICAFSALLFLLYVEIKFVWINSSIENYPENVASCACAVEFKCV